MLKQNDKAPVHIKIINEEGKNIELGDLVKQSPIVLYFYPKDNTPGCTLEACDFRDYNKEISKLGYIIYGVSKDTIDSHNRFKTKHNLNFPLLSDPDLKIHDAFGVIVNKSMFGRKYKGTQRSTFIINTDGLITKVWPRVKASGHAKEVYDYIKEINN